MDLRERAKNILISSLPYYVFVGMFLFLYMQFRLVGPQFDDYGYYTLNYSARELHFGSEYSFAELFSFLKEHYFTANGRLFYDGIWLSLFKIGRNELIQLIAAMTVTAVFGLLYKIGMESPSTKNKRNVFGLIGAYVLCISFGCIDVLLHQHGTYWYAAFFTYYMPLIPLLVFVLLYDKKYGQFDGKTTVLLSVLSFMSAWSGETLSVGVVVLMIVLVAAEGWRRKRVDVSHVLYACAALAGLLILLCSPGIQNRAGDRQWGMAAIGDAFDNARIVFGFMFFEGNRRYWLFVLAACFFLAVSLYIKRRKVVDLICAVLLAALEGLTIINYSLIQNIIGRTWTTTILCVAVIMGAILIPVSRHYYFVRDRKQPMILLVAIMSVLSLVVVPEIQHRVIIPFEICSLLLVFEAYRELYDGVIEKKYAFPKKTLYVCGGVVASLFVLAMSFVSIKNTARIYGGYVANAIVNEHNEAVILEAKQAIERGEVVERITLRKMADDRYASVTLYQQEWFRPYVNSYYELPQNITYTFE